ncbi:glycosyltransferase family 39 protein [Streptomyces sp. NPDC057199]|uniref:glycosyltransferase family 39 protein n=1 Tax=Streptomyces sp. NPDC057199 TaxID=3346047 RepID=UPI0036433590
MTTTQPVVGAEGDDRSTSSAGRSRLRRILRAPGPVFLLPAFATLLSCLWGIGRRSAWRDEHATWWAASLSFGDLYELTRNVDLAIAPYYVFVHLWVSLFGDSLTVLRLPSVLAMAVAGGLVGLLGRRAVGSTRGGIVAGLLFALVPTVARHGQEARPYAFAMLAAVLGFLALLRALERPVPRRWVLYALTVPLMGWSHLVALTVLVAHLAAVLDARRRSDRPVLGAWLIAVGAGLAPVVPLVVLARTQAQQIAWNTPAWNDIAAMPYMLFRSPVATAVVLGGASVGMVAGFRRRRGNRPDPGLGSGSGPDTVSGSGLGPDTGSDSGLGPGPGSDSGLRTRLTPLALWALAPFLLTAATARWLHLFLDRYLLFTVPAWILLATIGIHRLTARPRVVGRLAAVLVAVIAVFAPLDRGTVTRNTPNEPDYHSVALKILADQRPGDGIAYTHRLKARRALDFELREGPRPRDVLLHDTPRQRADYEAGECPDPRRCAAGYERIWLVAAGRSKDPFSGMEQHKSRLLREEFRTVRTADFANVRLLLLERGP